MIRSLVLYFIFPSLIIAFVLSFAGITQVASGEGFHLWLKAVNQNFESWSFSIPRIPKINYLDDYQAVKSIKRVVTVPIFQTGTTFKQKFVDFVNFLIMVINGITSVLNVLITIINVLIQLIQFALTIVYCFKDIPQYAVIGNDGVNLWWYQNIS